jgi:diguanylate cyclase (GGDEF)-like protein
MDDKLLTLLRGCTNLPSPPAVATRIIELSSCHTSTLGDVADAVGIDPALSAKLLRMANSPLYARQRKIENLRQAITLFGIEGTLNIALSFSLTKSSENNSASGLDYNMYWKRSLASALLCQEFGQRISNESKDSLFLIGLLQDIGIIALDKAVPTLYSNLDENQTSHAIFCEQEVEVLGADHSKVGAWLLSEWHIPEAILNPISNSHLPLNEDTRNDVDDTSRCVAAACLMADIFVADDIESAIFNAINNVEKIVKLERAEYNEIIASVSSNFAEMANMFEIELGDKQLLDSILDQAKEILILRNLSKIRETESLQEKTEELKTQTRELELVSRHDPLTGLYNRRHFDQCIRQEFENSKKYEWPLGLIFIDLDHFKQVNDTHGHAAGDEILVHTAKLLLDCMRDTDIVSRYGGEEFTVLLPGIDKEGTEIACERLVNWFRENPARLQNGEVIKQTISAGAAICFGEKFYRDWSQLIRNADEAVYHAKENGRDQYCIFDLEQRVTPKMLAS